MKKKYKVSLIALFAALLSAVLIAVYLLTSGSASVYAADRYVTVDGSNVFYTSIRGASVTAGKETTKGADDMDEDHYYTLFKIGKDETVAYRKSLAYKWITGEKDDKDNLTGVYSEKFFNMEIGFDNLSFKRYIIEFQSQQYLMTEDKITKNYLVFTPQENNTVEIAAVQSLDAEIDNPVTCSAEDKIKISFDGFNEGKVTVSINGVGEVFFKNVYEPYASYVSSGDYAVTPLTFSAEFEENAQPAEGADELTADMKLYSLNGQSFELFAHDTDGVYNDVRDNAPPVMCFTKTPSYVEFGKKLDFSYQVIDVLATSPRSTANFYVLTGDQYGATDFDYSKTDYDSSSSSDESDDEDNKTEYKNPFTVASSTSDIRIIRDDKTFVPARYLEGGSAYSDDYTVYGLIKIYYEISDVTGSSAKTDKVFVDWYAKDDALVDIYSAEYKNVAGKSEKFLKIIDGKSGVTYAAGEDATYGEYKHTIEDLTTSYQQKINDAIKDLEDGKLYAGGDNKFYLPAFDLLFGDEYSRLQDYKYSIYYSAKTTGSNTSLDYNKLSIALSEADVTYRFTVYITDSFGNPMRYPDKNGEWQEITTNDIWDEDYADLLPFFEFPVYYKEATAKNPESHSVAYVGTNYSGVSFDIKGVSGTYTTKYNLYIFDRNAAYNELGLDMTYAEFVEKFDNNKLFEDATYRKYFTTVKPANELQETDENYELFKAINWNATNVSFVPQSAEEFYIVRLSLTDNRSQTTTNNFVAVAASIQANSLKGESDWVQNNIAAIVLLSVAGVLFIAFIVLLVVKPKDKGDIDEIYENDVKAKKNKKK